METSPKNLLDQTKPARRSRRAWYLYDFGNSAYAAIVLLAVYSAYFKNAVVGGAEGTRLWGWSVGIAAVLVALISPVLGSIADFSRSKKRLLFIFTTIAVVFTGMLFFVRPGDVLIGMLFFILAEIGYRGAQVFYDALLVDVSTPKTIGYISGKGWAVGMLGGVACLIIVLVPMQLIGNSFIPYTFLITALFFLLSSIPTFLHVREITEPEVIPAGETVFGLAFKKLGRTFREIKSYGEFLKIHGRLPGLQRRHHDADGLCRHHRRDAVWHGAGTADPVRHRDPNHGCRRRALVRQNFGQAKQQTSDYHLAPDSYRLADRTVFIKSNVMFFVIGAFAGFSLSGAGLSAARWSASWRQRAKPRVLRFPQSRGRTSTFVVLCVQHGLVPGA